MSLVIIAFKNAPTPTPECKAKDDALNNEIRKKTAGTCVASLLKIPRVEKYIVTVACLV